MRVAELDSMNHLKIYVDIGSKNLKCHASNFTYRWMLLLSILCTFDCFDYLLLKSTCSF